MPLYNNAEHFPEAVESILNQSFSDFECIVVEDGSEDGSPALLRAYAKRDKRVRPIFLKKRGGVVVARQTGLEASRASLVAVMDADDLSLPCRLQKQHDYMQKHENVGLLGCGFFRFRENAKGGKRVVSSTRSLPSKREEQHRYRTGRPLILCCASAMFRRNVALQAGGYRDFFANGAEDRDFVLRMHERTEVANLADKLYAYRFNSDSSFRKDKAGVKACTMMATYCALRRRHSKKGSGQKDPLERAKPLTRLTGVLGLPSSLCLEDLQRDPRWMTELLFQWLEEKPFDADTCARLYLGLIGNRLRGKGGWHRAVACLVRAIRLDGRLTARLVVSVCLGGLSCLSVWHGDFWRQPRLENR